jgi:uncharacterized protein YceK
MTRKILALATMIVALVIATGCSSLVAHLVPGANDAKLNADRNKPELWE